MGILKEIDYKEIEFKTSSTKMTISDKFVAGKNSWFYNCIASPLPEHREFGRGYRAIIETDEGSGFVATIPALPGCVTEGETLEATFDHLRDALRGWIQVAEDKNLNIPEPDWPFSL